MNGLIKAFFRETIVRPRDNFWGQRGFCRYKGKYISDFYITSTHEGLNVNSSGVYKVPIGGTKTPNPFINSGKEIFYNKNTVYAK